MSPLRVSGERPSAPAPRWRARARAPRPPHLVRRVRGGLRSGLRARRDRLGVTGAAASPARSSEPGNGLVAGVAPASVVEQPATAQARRRRRPRDDATHRSRRRYGQVAHAPNLAGGPNPPIHPIPDNAQRGVGLRPPPPRAASRSLSSPSDAEHAAQAAGLLLRLLGAAVTTDSLGWTSTKPCRRTPSGPSRRSPPRSIDLRRPCPPDVHAHAGVHMTTACASAKRGTRDVEGDRVTLW